MESINAYFPFIFSKTVDPRDVFTVGDQVICEHLFAYHARESVRGGFDSQYSNVDIDFLKKQITVTPVKKLKSYKGQEFSIDDYCNSFKESVSNSHHANIASLIKSVDCQKDRFEIQFQKMPINIKYLFTLPDFSIFNKSELPLEQNSLLVKDTTGPYTYTKFTENQIELQINPNYDNKLRANKVKKVFLNSYASESTTDFVENLDPGKHQLAYLYGHTVTNDHINLIREKRYSIRQTPSEWLILIFMNISMPKDIRSYFYLELHKRRKDFLKSAPLGQPAYGVSPYDRSFGIKESEFEKQISENINFSKPMLKRKYILATLDEWANIPLFKSILSFFQSEMSDLVEVKLFPRSELSQIWSSKIDMGLTPLGIAQADPLSSFNFLAPIRDLISDKELLDASVVTSEEEFNEEMKKIEGKITTHRRMFPIGHFPGVVLETPLLERDESVTWAWGIQAWTYKVH